jgi:urea transport system ATP-binding protein
MLQIQGLNQFYGESHTLWDVEFDIPQGSCVCLMGRNGVGKTTLLRTIMGLIRAQSGEVLFEEKDLLPKRADERARLGIGYVPQGREIFAQLSVEENLRISLSARRDKLRHIPERIFELFPVLKQMLILDEPTEGIQPNIVQQIGDVILKLNEEENLTVLLVEQKLPFARRVGKQFVIMDRGRTVAKGEMPALDEQLVQRYLTV